jgi:tetratricopeptide (TPR) repeat protein
MSTGYLHKPISLPLVFFLMLILSPTARSAIIEPDSAARERQSIVEMMQQLPALGTDHVVSGPVAINSVKKAAKASAMLEDRLLKMGEIAGVIPLAPRIIEFRPNEPKIRYLYAIALAAQGNVDHADKGLRSVSQNHEKHILGLFALSAISKARNQVELAVKYADMSIRMAPYHPYGYNLLGQIQAGKGNYDDAMSNFVAATKRAPQFMAALSNLGSTYFLLGKHKEAKDAFSNALKLSSSYCPALIGRASVSLQFNEFTNAVSDLERCVKADTSQLIARRKLVTTYIQYGDLEKAVDLATASLDLDPLFFDVKLAEIQLRMNMPQSARMHLNRIASKDADVLFLLSLCDVLEGSAKRAQANILAAQQVAPDAAILKVTKQIIGFYDAQPVDLRELEALSAEAAVKPLAALTLGNVHAVDGKYEKTRAYWDQARGIIPGFLMDGMTSSDLQAASSSEEQRFLNLGVLLYLKSFFKPALSEFDKALKENPRSFLANFLYALTLIQIDATNDPSSNLIKSTQSAPGFFPANYMLAEYYLKRKDIDKALHYYTAATESFPDQGALMKLALIYENRGQQKQAESTYRRFIKHHPNSFLGYNQLAWLYAQQGRRLDEALGLARKADELRPGNTSVNDTIGWLLYLKKEYAQAEQHLKKANNISRGNNPEIRYHLAVVLKERGKTSEAKQHLSRAFKLSDRFAGIDEAKRLAETLGVVIINPAP